MNIQHSITSTGALSYLPAGEMHTLALDGVQYLALPVQKTPQLFDTIGSVLALTIFSISATEVLSPQRIQNQISEWLKIDDVFRPSFLSHVAIVSTDQETIEQVPHICDTLRRQWGTESCVSVSEDLFETRLPQGPHFLWNGALCKPFRLYDDVQQAFMLATRPRIRASDPYGNLRLSGDFPPSLSVAVPSRIRHLDNSQSPLNGMRFAVKDLFQIEGLRLTVGCRAYYEVADRADATAPLLQRLIDLGAELVGTLKLGSLITKEEPAESADYQAPFNPRGDGYQSAWSSSGGSGAAVASYDWLDFTLGTDTTGSSRRPALANGCFQMRLSHDALPQKGIIPSFRPFDAPAVFSRDVQELERIVGAWIDSKPKSYDDVPLKIAYLNDYFPVNNEHQQKLIEKFIEDFASSLSAETSRFSLSDLWKKNTPMPARGSSIEDYLEEVGVTSFCYGLYHELDDFRSRYHERFGKEPYVNPSTRWRWNAASNVTADQHKDAMDRLSIYRKWLLEEVLRVGKRNTLIIIPITTQEVDYRDEPADPPSAPSAFQPLWLAPILGAPEISVPIGEMKYHSRVSQRDEYLPIVVSILGTPGTDMALISTVIKALQKSGRPTRVTTGSRMFEKKTSHA